MEQWCEASTEGVSNVVQTVERGKGAGGTREAVMERGGGEAGGKLMNQLW